MSFGNDGLAQTDIVADDVLWWVGSLVDAMRFATLSAYAYDV